MKKQSNKKINSGIMRIAFVTILMLLLSLSSALPAHATDGNGRISGHLLDGSNQKAPLAGQQVTLQVAQGQNSQDLKTTTTDAQGGYVFDNLATDKTMNYAVYIRYQGAHYATDAVTLDSKPTQQLDLTAYQATSDSSKIFVGRMTALVHEPDIQTKTVTISEIYTLSNLDTRAYVGSLQASKGMPNALRFWLPQGARKITLDKGFNGYQVIQVDRGFASDAAVLPGDNEFAFSYQVPYNATKLALSYTTVYPTLSYSFMVPPDLHFSSKALKSKGIVNSGNDQRPYNLFSATQLSAKSEIPIQLEGLILPESTAPLALNPQLIWLLVAIGFMLAILGFTWYYRRSLVSKRSSAARGQKGRAKGIEAKPTSKKVTSSSAKDREQALLQELLELDQAYEAGKLQKPIYDERRKKIKARLRTVLREKETKEVTQR